MQILVSFWSQGFALGFLDLESLLPIINVFNRPNFCLMLFLQSCQRDRSQVQVGAQQAEVRQPVGVHRRRRRRQRRCQQR